MRIISPFHDYYDNALGFGQDKTVVYVRKPEVKTTGIEGLTLPWQEMRANAKIIKWGSALRGYRSLVQALILVGGKVYLRWVDPRRIMQAENEFDTRVTHGSSDPDELLERSSIHVERFEQESAWDLERAGRYNSLLDAFAQRTDLDKIHHTYNAPIVMLLPHNKPYAITNIPLLCFGIQEDLHAFEAFQAVSQYVDGILPRAGHEMVQLSDKELIVKAGFDLKTSFRNPIK